MQKGWIGGAKELRVGHHVASFICQIIIDADVETAASVVVCAMSASCWFDFDIKFSHVDCGSTSWREKRGTQPEDKHQFRAITNGCERDGKTCTDLSRAA